MKIARHSPVLLIVALLMVMCTPSPLETAPAVRSVPAGVVPASLFGMHYVAAWASPAPFPDGVGLFRMHDATPRWERLHVGPNTWDMEALNRIDAVLLYANREAPGALKVYVLAGGFPEWVHAGRIREEWREHVRLIADRYAGRIDALEVWNEADSRQWYSGTPSLLVELTRIVREEWPGTVIAPSFTQDGLAAMEDFYLMGGGRYVDIAAWHHGVTHPEADTVAIQTAKRIAGPLPLWTTEMNVRGGAAELVRAYLVHYLFGVESVGFYSWEMWTYNVPGAFAHTSDSTGAITEAGRAWLDLQDWLVGREVTAWNAEGGEWSVSLSDGRRIEWTDSTMPVRR